MRIFFVFAATLSLSFSAPQFPQTDNNVGANCHTEVETVFEEVESETLNKVICETEFRDSCESQVETVCRNVTSGGQVECRQVDSFQCVDSMTNKCGVEAVLKNVSYTETVCQMVEQDICEMETVGGESRPVPGSCASKELEDCSPVTRFVEEFVNEEVCRDIPIKDCKTVQEEVCTEKVEEVCEDLETQKCDIVPHEECRQVVDKVPRRVSKKVTKVVCDDKESMTMATEQEQEDDDVPSIQDILEIFGVNISDNDVNIDDTFINEASSTTTTTTQSSSTTSTTTQTTSTTTTKTTSTTRKSSTISPEFDTTTTVTPAVERRADGSKIIFSDAAIDNRNKDLATRVYVGRVTSTSRPSIVREQLPNSQIFFPE